MNWPQENKIHYFLSSLFTNQYKIETVGNRWVVTSVGSEEDAEQGAQCLCPLDRRKLLSESPETSNVFYGAQIRLYTTIREGLVCKHRTVEIYLYH